ncbi:MAG: OsmC family protein [Spirochaetota bacterium]
MKITSRHVAGCYQSVVDNGRNHGVVLDLPEKKAGDNVGATALEMAAMALAGCISTIWAVVANNSKCSYRKIIVELDIDKPDDAPTFTKGTAHVRIDSDESEEKLRRILDKTINACPVGKLFEAANVEIGTTLERTRLIPE